jgi:Fur family transcriptional regulator, stress-responsive regulator
VPTRTEVEQLLREAGLRVTRPRVAVLTAVHERQDADTDSIIGVAREDLGAFWGLCPDCSADDKETRT